MSWNLLIYKPGTAEANEPMGNLEAVTKAFNREFPDLEWDSPTEAGLNVDGGFMLTIGAEDGLVQDVYTRGGYNHLRQFAAICKREGWRIGDAQDGDEVDLDDPYKSYEDRGE